MSLYGDYASKQDKETEENAFVSEISKLNRECLSLEMKLRDAEHQLRYMTDELEAERQRRADLAFSVIDFVYSTTEMEPDIINVSVKLPPTILQSDLELAVTEAIKREVVNASEKSALQRKYALRRKETIND